MGNRANISVRSNKNTIHQPMNIYLQWNGGIESICAFVHVLNIREWTLHNTLLINFASIVTEYHDVHAIHNGASVYLQNGPAQDTDNGDNGYYILEVINNLIVISHNGGDFKTVKHHVECFKEQWQFNQFAQMIKELQTNRRDRFKQYRKHCRLNNFVGDKDVNQKQFDSTSIFADIKLGVPV